MADDAKPVGYEAGLKNITKMTINIELFDLGICSCMRGHIAISSFIWVIIVIDVIGFGKGF